MKTPKFNNSQFTLSQIREVLPLLLGEERGVTINRCGSDPDICELILKDELEIETVEESNGVLDITFSQNFPGDPSFDNLDAWTWTYQTIQEVEIFKMYLHGKTAHNTVRS